MAFYLDKEPFLYLNLRFIFICLILAFGHFSNWFQVEVRKIMTNILIMTGKRRIIFSISRKGYCILLNSLKFDVIFSPSRRAFRFLPNFKNKPNIFEDLWNANCTYLLLYSLHLPVWWSVMQRKNICLHYYWAERRKNFGEFVSSKYCRGRVTSEKLSSVPNKHTGPDKCRAF